MGGGRSFPSQGFLGQRVVSPSACIPHSLLVSGMQIAKGQDSQPPSMPLSVETDRLLPCGGEVKPPSRLPSESWACFLLAGAASPVLWPASVLGQSGSFARERGLGAGRGKVRSGDGKIPESSPETCQDWQPGTGLEEWIVPSRCPFRASRLTPDFEDCGLTLGLAMAGAGADADWRPSFGCSVLVSKKCSVDKSK